MKFEKSIKSQTCFILSGRGEHSNGPNQIATLYNGYCLRIYLTYVFLCQLCKMLMESMYFLWKYQQNLFPNKFSICCLKYSSLSKWLILSKEKLQSQNHHTNHVMDISVSLVILVKIKEFRLPLLGRRYLE